MKQESAPDESSGHSLGNKVEEEVTERISTQAKLGPPPNYSSRAIQMKLMALVGSLMLVILLMVKASDPETWAFMGFDQQQEATEGETDEDLVDTRLYPGQRSSSTVESISDPVPPNRDIPKSSGDKSEVSDSKSDSEQGVDSNLQRDQRSSNDLRESRNNADLLRKTKADFWGRTLGKLDSDSRDLLVAGLYQGRSGQPLENEQSERWVKLASWLNQQRELYHAEILQAVSELPLQASQLKRDKWTAILSQMQTEWNPYYEALVAISDGTTIEQVQELNELQREIDQVMLTWIKDDVIGTRFEEKQIWFRLLEQLQGKELKFEIENGKSVGSNSESDSVAQVSFLQLFKQPQVYRGKRIQIEGSLYRAEYRKADENRLGVAGYHVLWFRSLGKSASPVVVYALTLPPGFPDYDENGLVEFPRFQNPEIRVEGIFYKRWGYNAQDGLRLAPLVLAKDFEWKPFQMESTRESYSLGGWAWLGIIAGIAAAAAVLAVTANRLVRQKSLTQEHVKRSAVQTAAIDQMKHDRGPGLHLDELIEQDSSNS